MGPGAVVSADVLLMALGLLFISEEPLEAKHFLDTSRRQAAAALGTQGCRT